MSAWKGTVRRTLTAFGVELSKAVRQKQTYAGPFVIALLLLAGLVAQPVSRDVHQDYAYIAYVTPVAVSSAGFLLALLFAAMLISHELGSGSIRQILVRPIHRGEYFAAKYLLGCAYALLLNLVGAGGAWLIAYVLGDLRGISFGGELVHSPEAMISAYLGGFLAGLAPAMAGVACALAVSACTRSTVTAVSLVIGGWLVVDLLKYPLGVEAWIFTTHLEGAWQVFNDRCLGLDAPWEPLLWRGLPASAVVAAASLALGAAVLRRRNLTG